MCRPTRCSRCGNTTWAGCGQHVDQVMANVPAGRRCTCNGSSRGSVDASEEKPSLLRRLRGR